MQVNPTTSPITSAQRTDTELITTWNHLAIPAGDLEGIANDSSVPDLTVSLRTDLFTLRVLNKSTPYAALSVNGRFLYRIVKRSLDLAISLAVLLLALPLFAGVAVLIKLTSPGPVFFRQKRLGRNGKEFSCIKFRTMYADAEERLRRDIHLQREFEESYKLKSDPRVMPVGALLRKTSLDELPQLLNVLRGEMCLVGPRPIVPPELSKYSIYGKKLLSVKPGLSGLWQVSGRSDIAYPERVLLDMHYIDYRCLLLDLKVMLLTPLAVLRGHGAC